MKLGLLASAGMLGSSLLGGLFGSKTAKDIAKQTQRYNRESAILNMMLANKQMKRMQPFYEKGLEALEMYSQEAFNPEQSQFYRIMVQDITKRLNDEFARRGLGSSSEFFRAYSDALNRLASEERERQIARLQNLANLGFSAVTGSSPVQVAPSVTYGLTAGSGNYSNALLNALGLQRDFWNSLGNIGLALLGRYFK